MNNYYLDLETKIKKLWQFVKDMDKELTQNQLEEIKRLNKEMEI